ncbi:hypothetical protein NI468_02330 [Acinetobacter lwoffii]|uniref:hypothetical protein n=1 Tax=Acinetobacter lwoffii TaxID=28090 RepID=UPI00209753A0|nr:hypothetical protein [Acinetobacter lwoffii]MCO8069380.1 hypothetical protein [Acinetobacter lwoffii]
MLKAIFGIIIFFFFVSVLFLGIRFIFQSILNFMKTSQTEQKLPRYKNQIESHNSLIRSAENDHEIQFFDPTLNKITTLSGHLVKCYEEHQQLWIKLISLGQSAPKTIKVNNISMVENLLTKEILCNENSIEQYFKRFL